MNKSDNEQYWKKRALDKMQSVLNQLHVDFKTVNDNLSHVNCSTEKAKKIQEKIYTDIVELIKEIANAEVKE